MCRIGARPYMMCPRLQLIVGKRPCLGLLDSGSAVSLIDERVFGEMGAKLELTDLKLHSASAQPLQVKGVAKVRIKIAGFVWKYRFVVASKLPFEVIVGADFMCKTGMVMDLQEGHVYFKFCPEGKIVMGSQECEGVAKICASGDPFFQEEEGEEGPSLGHLNASQQGAIRGVIRDFSDVIIRG